MFNFSPNTRVKSAEVNQNYTDLSTGVGDVDGNRLQLLVGENFAPHVVKGMVWSVASGLNGAMTAGIAWTVNTTTSMGTRHSVSAIVSQAFTVSKDTYVDLTNAGVITYTEVANNAASPALAANSIRIAIVVTNATVIVATGINQGEETKILPIASGTAYSVVDSLGNLICSRDPLTRIIGLRQVTVAQTVTGTLVDATGLNMNIIVPVGRKVEIDLYVSGYLSSVNNDIGTATILIDNVAVTDGTWTHNGIAGSTMGAAKVTITITPTPGTRAINVKYQRVVGTGGFLFGATAARPAQIVARLV